MADEGAAGLLPCPFCGGTDLDEDIADHAWPNHYVECQKCGARVGPDGSAVEAWNRRAANESQAGTEEGAAAKLSAEQVAFCRSFYNSCENGVWPSHLMQFARALLAAGRAARTEATKAEPVAVVTDNNQPGEGMHLVRGINGHLTLDVGMKLFAAPPSADSVRREALKEAANLVLTKAETVSGIGLAEAILGLAAQQPASTETAEPLPRVVTDGWIVRKPGERRWSEPHWGPLDHPDFVGEGAASCSVPPFCPMPATPASPAEQASPPDDAVRLSSEEREAWALHVLRSIINDLPTARDWLDPAMERAARDLIADRRSRAETPTNAKAVEHDRMIVAAMIWHAHARDDIEDWSDDAQGRSEAYHLADRILAALNARAEPQAA